MKTLLFVLPVFAFAQTGMIEGVATDKLTKAPVAGVRVRMTAAGEPGRYYDVTTDSSGVYRFESLPVGSYSPSVDRTIGYFPPDPMQMALRRIRLDVKETETAKWDVELTPASVLRGRVYDPDGKPLPGAVILAHGVTAQLGSGRTDGEGRFSIKLAPGKYRLEVRSLSDFVSPGIEVDVAEAMDLGGHDIRLRRLEGHKVSGIVKNPDGKPAAGANVTVRDSKVKSGKDGAFEFPLVPAGYWKITAKADHNLIDWVGSIAVTIASRDVEGVVIRVDPPFDLDVAAEGAPKDRRPLQFRLLLPEATGFPPQATERDGQARFHALYPGLYRPGVLGMIPGYYVKTVFLGDADVTGRQVELGPESPALRYLYARGGGRIAGEVEDGASARVALIWADRDNYVPGPDFFSVVCDDHGRFTWGDLRPGNWYAIAFRGNIQDIRSHVFDRGRWRDAASVKVAEGETASVKISIASF